MAVLVEQWILNDVHDTFHVWKKSCVFHQTTDSSTMTFPPSTYFENLVGTLGSALVTICMWITFLHLYLLHFKSRLRNHQLILHNRVPSVEATPLGNQWVHSCTPFDKPIKLYLLVFFEPRVLNIGNSWSMTSTNLICCKLVSFQTSLIFRNNRPKKWCTNDFKWLTVRPVDRDLQFRFTVFNMQVNFTDILCKILL